MALFRSGKSKTAVVDIGEIVDVTDSAVRVNLSIHDTPHHDDRIGEALCMVGPGTNRGETTGAVVPIGRHPHRVTREEFAHLIESAGAGGNLLDGFLEIEAVIDLDKGIIVWEPEDGPSVKLLKLDEVVENTFAALVETNLLGEWFAPRTVSRGISLDAITAEPAKSSRRR